MADKLDLIIYNDDGVYKVERKVWQQAANHISADLVGDAAVLVKRGALVADVPTPTIPIGFYCFLINLAQLADAKPGPKLDQKAKTDQPLGDDGLVIHVLKDEYYVLPESKWKKKRIGDYPGAPQNGVICAQTDDGFVVNLPRIRR